MRAPRSLHNEAIALPKPNLSMPSHHDTFITPAQAALLKNVTRSAIYKAIGDGRLPAQEQLGRVALRESDVRAWTPLNQGGKRKTTSVSPEVREKISQGQKRRWQTRKNIALSSDSPDDEAKV